MPTTVTATDGTSIESHDVTDNYVLTTDGTAYVHGVQVHRHKDGTSTHVITVKGLR